jgi:hypothetical protein
MLACTLLMTYASMRMIYLRELQGCWAIWNLSDDCVENQVMLGNAGACELLVEILSLHGRKSYNVAEQVS